MFCCLVPHNIHHWAIVNTKLTGKSIACLASFTREKRSRKKTSLENNLKIQTLHFHLTGFSKVNRKDN